MEEVKPQLLKITFDGIEVEVEPGTPLCRRRVKLPKRDDSQGHLVPPLAISYYKPLPVSGGKCRACLVKVSAGSAKDPRPMPKLVHPVSHRFRMVMDLVENTTNPAVLDTRKSIVEFLLINHLL